MEKHQTGVLCFSTESLLDGQLPKKLVRTPYKVTYSYETEEVDQETGKPEVVTINAFDDDSKVTKEQDREFQANLKNKSIKVNTAAPDTSSIVSRLNELEAQGCEEIAVIIPSEKLSAGGHTAAHSAASQSYEGNSTISLLDSNAISAPEGFIVQEAYKVAQKGGTVNDIEAAVEETLGKTHVAQVLPDLEQLRLNGRIGRAQQIGAGILGMHALITLEDGALNKLGKEKGWKKSNRKALELLADMTLGKTVELAIVYYDVEPEKLQRCVELAREILKIQNDQNIIVRQQSYVISAHTGLGTVGYCAHELD